ncbi:MAG: CotH kinase family protein [Cryomorphaceae bacterium]|nr:CotH kinase family protein [Cryomorphaceae bacterium]
MKLNLTAFIKLLFIAIFPNVIFGQNIAINEFMASNRTTIADEDNDFEDWIEIYNFGTDTIDLDGYGLSDDANQPFRWTFPQISIAPNTYLLIWASGKDRNNPAQPLHTNFSISASGEDLLLTRPDSLQVDFVPATTLQMDVSYGRQPNGTGSWLFFYTPTPNAPNTGTGLANLLTPPFFSHTSGLYNANFTLSLNHVNPNVTIVYTLDGSEPDINNVSGTVFSYKNQYQRDPSDPPGALLASKYESHIYNNPINIADRSNQPDSLTKKNPSQFPMYNPPTPVRKGTVVRARAYIGNIPSQIATQTYFVWPNGNPYNIPVVSLTTPEKHLFDYDDGIYTAGVDFDTWRANNPNDNQWWRPDWNNFWRRGRAWEYPMNVEMFEPQNFNSILNQDVGFRIHGNNSRIFMIKNLRLYARGDYHQESTFTLPGLFDRDLIGATGSEKDTYKRLMLRSDGTGGAVYYDVFFSRMFEPFHPMVMRNRPIIHFINGEYWGISAIRDRIDRHHYANQFGLDSDNIIQIRCNGFSCELSEGEPADFTDFADFRQHVRHSDLSVDSIYDWVASHFDMENYIDHLIFQIYSSDDSYERNFWRVRNPENSTYGDGKWRFDIQDFEAAMNLTQNFVSLWANPNWLTLTNISFYGKMITNDKFNIPYLTRFADLINTAFSPWRFEEVADSIRDVVEPYLAEDLHRSDRDHYYLASERQNLITYGVEHPSRQRDTLVSFFNLTGTFNTTLNVSDTIAGYITINTVDIKKGTVGVRNQPYPWDGVYFNDIPITLVARANPGFIFTHWSGDISSTDDSLVITRDVNLQIQANFINDTNPEVIYFWVMDTELPNNQPLDSMVATYSASGAHATIQYNSCLQGYPFNSSHNNWRKASMERRNAPTDINYRASANNDIPFSNANVRGLQIKQPFRIGSSENEMIMQFSTYGKKEIVLSFAAEDDGAADILRIDYWNGSEWSTTGLTNSALSLQNSYGFYEIDFSAVSRANNNPDFKIRIRFDGPDMRADNGNRVHFNNIAVEGVNTLSNKAFAPSYKLSAYPNPTEGLLTLTSNEQIEYVEVINLFGQTVLKTVERGETYRLSLDNLPSGVYLVRVGWREGEKTIRVIRR